MHAWKTKAKVKRLNCKEWRICPSAGINGYWLTDKCYCKQTLRERRECWSVFCLTAMWVVSSCLWATRWC